MDDEKKLEQAEEPKTEPKAEPESDGIDYDKLASILDGRQKANEESVLKGYFKEQGITGDEAAQAIAAFKKSQQDKQPDISGMQASIERLEQDIAAANNAANVAKVENAVIVEAVKLGIDPKVIPYLTRMADLSDVGEGGNISGERVAFALNKVLEDIPALKPQAKEQGGFKVGTDGDAPGKADDAKLKAIFGVK